MMSLCQSIGSVKVSLQGASGISWSFMITSGEMNPENSCGATDREVEV